MRSIRIISNGHPSGTHVVDALTGDELTGVTHVKWELDANSFSRAEITFIGAEIDALADDVDNQLDRDLEARDRMLARRGLRP